MKNKKQSKNSKKGLNNWNSMLNYKKEVDKNV